MRVLLPVREGEGVADKLVTVLLQVGALLIVSEDEALAEALEDLVWLPVWVIAGVPVDEEVRDKEPLALSELLKDRDFVRQGDGDVEGDPVLDFDARIVQERVRDPVAVTLNVGGLGVPVAVRDLVLPMETVEDRDTVAFPVEVMVKLVKDML